MTPFLRFILVIFLFLFSFFLHLNIIFIFENICIIYHYMVFTYKIAVILICAFMHHPINRDGFFISSNGKRKRKQKFSLAATRRAAMFRVRFSSKIKSS